jgi:hypothetical protein
VSPLDLAHCSPDDRESCATVWMLNSDGKYWPVSVQSSDDLKLIVPGMNKHIWDVDFLIFSQPKFAIYMVYTIHPNCPPDWSPYINYIASRILVDSFKLETPTPSIHNSLESTLTACLPRGCVCFVKRNGAHRSVHEKIAHYHLHEFKAHWSQFFIYQHPSTSTLVKGHFPTWKTYVKLQDDDVLHEVVTRTLLEHVDQDKITIGARVRAEITVLGSLLYHRCPEWFNFADFQHTVSRHPLFVKDRDDNTSEWREQEASDGYCKYKHSIERVSSFIDLQVAQNTHIMVLLAPKSPGSQKSPNTPTHG